MIYLSHLIFELIKGKALELLRLAVLAYIALKLTADI